MTFFIVVMLQIKIGPMTLEERAIQWVQGSSIIEPVELAAKGAVKMIQEAWKGSLGKMNSDFFKSLNKENIPGYRSIGVDLERSKSYLKDKAEQAANRASEVIDDYEEARPEKRTRRRPVNTDAYDEDQ